MKALALAIILSGLAGTASHAQMFAPPKTRSVDEAISLFNREASSDPVGKYQPPLTRGEFDAALRYALAGFTGEKAEHLSQILGTGIIPAGDYLNYMKGWANLNQSGHDIHAWMIYFTIARAHPSGLSVMWPTTIVRQQMIAVSPAAPPDPREQALFIQALHQMQASEGDHP